MTIKKLPAPLYARLKASAERHRRSINAEAIVCLERGLGLPAPDPGVLLAGLRAVRDRAPDVYVTDLDLAASKRQGLP